MDDMGPVHLLIVGAANGALGVAADMARAAGAKVVATRTTIAALQQLRDIGGDIVMIDIDQDIAGFITQLRTERIAVPVIACGIDASADQAVAAIRAGARDYLPLPPQPDLIASAILSVAQHGIRMVGESPALARATALGLALSHSHAPVLVVGERGSGKQSLARMIHAASARRGRFLTIDCAAGNDDILASELFGHAAGAFPGAVARRRGRIEEAADGTIVLRDADALSLAMQAQLLATLQGHGGPHGGHDFSPVSARIIASTARDLDSLVAAGRFNAPLLARLGLVRIAVPPLRDRRGDIAILAQYFAERFAFLSDLPVRELDDTAIAALLRHSWPGNVRELEDTIHRAVLLNAEPRIGATAIVTADGLPLGTHRASGAPEAPTPGAFVGRTVEDVERDLILRTLRHCRGNRTSASTILGISVRTMRNKLKSFIEAGIAVSPAP
ncbi:two component Fis family sigma54 specific transcriptional regulator [Sphingomonas sp. BK036]|uniref:sigma-54-dependent transcriptional regulator n=1 Tax=Sphingomonas sp. BK036 TaxID=2512122 RepID=UPI00102A31B3|nr:sigma-54 dependent transcriptional regulator [Sphingomonas sp. BK036]RZT53392.1 two component Fis family sigma54 specific transcriptional regulator [Sphingomonas sp. BK036]